MELNWDGLRLYVTTLRYLRWSQILARLWFKIYQPLVPRLLTMPKNEPKHPWIPPIKKAAKINDGKFHFSEQSHTISDPHIWQKPVEDKLWLYQLHYFDDLHADQLSSDEKLDLVQRWIRENRPKKSPGWEPYPLSIRVVNWIKWLLLENHTEPRVLNSLCQQAAYLNRRLEYHLLGNHLFVNAKALIFLGCFFKGRPAQRWLRKGLNLVNRQVKEQILEDGGHFERSPMYHASIFEDLLDLVNIMQTYGYAVPVNWRESITKMWEWLRCMTHPDGDIALFNDAVFGLVPRLVDLEAYGRRLGFDLKNDVPFQKVHYLEHSGYVRMVHPPFTLIADIAPLGPDYLLGHGHADTLSFELSYECQRIIVHPGLSCYHNCATRLQERGTSAHNTVQLDDLDSSEVWSSFRVARRAKPFAVDVSEREVAASHDGYAQLFRVIHRRCWRFTPHGLEITDAINGAKHHKITVFFHFHPDITLEPIYDDHSYSIYIQKKLIGYVCVDSRLEVQLEPFGYHPHFGKTQTSWRILGQIQCQLPQTLHHRITCHADNIPDGQLPP